jgi:hypothetical protein
MYFVLVFHNLFILCDNSQIMFCITSLLTTYYINAVGVDL